MVKSQKTAAEGPRYRSGAVSRLSGIPVETLRVWERRYNVVGPRQSLTGQRLYSPFDVARLTVIKQLVDSGHAIGSIAALKIEALQAMLNRTIDAAARATRAMSASGAGSGGPLRVVIVGEALALRMARHHAAALRIVSVAQNLSRALESIPASSADVMLIEAPTLPGDLVQNIRRLAEKIGVRRVVVEYGFAAKRSKHELQILGYTLMPAPLTPEQVDAVCCAPFGTSPRGAEVARSRIDSVTPPRFDNKMLAEISLAAVTLKCECPLHLSDLLVRLGNFETYSGECENDSPADAALHQYLKQLAGTARALLEPALVRVAEFEGIALRQPRHGTA